MRGPGSVPGPEVVAWCDRHLGSPPARVLFQAGHLSAVVGVELGDGRSVVLKCRPWAERIAGCALVQRHLWSAGFPCPEPLAGPTCLDGMAVTAEAAVSGGAQLEPGADSHELFAEAFADLVRLAPRGATRPDLAPPPSWVWWAHGQPGLWPPPDDRDVDLNAHPGPEWLDRLGALARDCLISWRGSEVVGHADWESQNLRWIERGLHVVHDWDSAACLPEPALVGAAAAVFTASGQPLSEPRIEAVEAFVAAYEQARGLRWSSAERAVVWAAGAWVRGFNAKKATLDEDGAPVLARLHREAPELMHRILA